MILQSMDLQSMCTGVLSCTTWNTKDSKNILKDFLFIYEIQYFVKYNTIQLNIKKMGPAGMMWRAILIEKKCIYNLQFGNKRGFSLRTLHEKFNRPINLMSVNYESGCAERLEAEGTS